MDNQTHTKFTILIDEPKRQTWAVLENGVIRLCQSIWIDEHGWRATDTTLTTRELAQLLRLSKAPMFEFVAQAARLTKDGECASCGKDGEEENPECAEHEPWDMPNDDAVDTVHSLISGARELMGDTQEGK